MQKVLILCLVLLLTAPAAFANPAAAGLEFYKKELVNFHPENNRETRAYAKSLADGLGTWARQNENQPAAKDALLMQARLYLRAQENGLAFVTLFKLRNLYPQMDMSLLKPLLADTLPALPKEQRNLALRLFSATLPADAQTPQDREAEMLYALSKISGKEMYPAITQAFEDFFARNPNHKSNDRVELWYGDLHRANGNYLAAIVQYKKTHELYPKSPYKAASLRMVGDVYAGDLKNTEKATEAYTRVLREFEGSNEIGIVYKHMAIMDENNKNYDSALINYDKAIELLCTAPNAYEAYRGKADVFVKMKNYEEAYNQLHQTAAAYAAEEDKAVSCWVKAAELAEKRLREPAKYTQTLEKALLAYPKGTQAPELMFDLAQGYEDQGKTAQAIEIYKKLIINYPTDKRASRAQGKLNKLQK